MKYKEISFSKSVKYSDTKYGSRGVNFSMTVDLEDGEDRDEKVMELKREVQRHINESLTHYGVSSELKDFYQSREADEPSQNWPSTERKAPF